MVAGRCGRSRSNGVYAYHDHPSKNHWIHFRRCDDIVDGSLRFYEDEFIWQRLRVFRQLVQLLTFNFGFAMILNRCFNAFRLSNPTFPRHIYVDRFLLTYPKGGLRIRRSERGCDCPARKSVQYRIGREVSYDNGTSVVCAK